jgi:Flp pilus assembly protein TadG
MIARRGRGDRGAILAESALILPILLTIVLGGIDFCYIDLQYDAASSAARDGARVGLLNHNVTTVGAQTSCSPSPADAQFTAICKAVVKRLAGTATVTSVQVICYAGVGPSAPLPTDATDPNTQATCSSSQVQPDASTISVIVTWKVSPLTFVGATLIGTKTTTATARMVIAG